MQKELNDRKGMNIVLFLAWGFQAYKKGFFSWLLDLILEINVKANVSQAFFFFILPSLLYLGGY